MTETLKNAVEIKSLKRHVGHATPDGKYRLLSVGRTPLFTNAADYEKEHIVICTSKNWIEIVSNFSITDNFLAVDVKENYLIAYVYYILKYNKQLHNSYESKKTISKRDILNVPIKTLSVEEQKEFIRKVQNTEKEIEEYEKQIKNKYEAIQQLLEQR